MSPRYLPLLLLLCSAAVAHSQNDDAVRINEIQVIGTHNSYHAGLAPSEHKWLQEKNPQAMLALDYHHAPLTDQLNGGVRQIELDVYADSHGGRYAHPAIDTFVKQAGLPPDPDFDPQHLMDKPGFKVMHVQDIDERSTCQPFTACLAEVRAWSRAHPGHVPIFILVETKETPLGSRAGFNAVQPEPFTPSVFDALDQEILSVFPRREIVLPDQVRGKYDTLDEAVHHGNWPTLGKSRGKVVFLLDQRKVSRVYTEGHVALRGRVLFTNAEPGTPDAAFTEENDGSVETIDALVRQGYLVRTRADADTRQARDNDTSRRDETLSSGAQMVSTDYPSTEPAPSGYVVTLPGNEAARCNTVLKPQGCVDRQLESKQ
ncbi:phosphatidylinositol-specific phospholipase C1-like protein [Paracidobacterium acidisoli]|uniref:Calcium-dependent phosphoinositide phospholipase C n=1 Tax=Paracidobacterium acidisoli TaxID=2303751 RepID=A0A372IS11_9BACT|nr:phosphatidylinositol-specific phospholipase C1-like protein [Paracidobacterium acidisoli]MBT9330628.1 phosphatidylinositol-specific phospholipase C1-like protein [Paracidobacterium acidisoli]